MSRQELSKGELYQLKTPVFALFTMGRRAHKQAYVPIWSVLLRAGVEKPSSMRFRSLQSFRLCLLCGDPEPRPSTINQSPQPSERRGPLLMYKAGSGGQSQERSMSLRRVCDQLVLCMQLRHGDVSLSEPAESLRAEQDVYLRTRETALAQLLFALLFV